MAILLYCILLAVIQSGSHAFEFTVGGKNGWQVPNDTNTEIYNEWAGRNRFKVGDSLVFAYNSSEDSVLQVNDTDYKNCNTSHPIATINKNCNTSNPIATINSVFKLPHSGPFYFISGASGHCEKFQKLHVVVLHAPPGPVPAPAPVVHAPVAAPAPVVHAPVPAPAPSPSPSMVPAVPPTSTAVPAAPVLQSAGYMCGLLISVCVFIL